MPKQRRRFVAVLVLAAAISWHSAVNATEYKPNTLDPAYRHDRFVTRPVDHLEHFRAFTTSFDSDDDDTGDGKPDRFGVPEWVAYEIHAISGRQKRGPARPRTWITNRQLHARRIAPGDDSYTNSGYSRGHMCMKQIALRLGPDADWNSHTVLNACPQLQDFNDGIWYDLEKKTMSWADAFGKIWVICGPVFDQARDIQWIGDPGEVPVAVPHAYYKIVIRENPDTRRLDVLAFIYPHRDIKKTHGKYNHEAYLETIDAVEAATNLDFLTALPDREETAIERRKASQLWPVE